MEDEDVRQFNAEDLTKEQLWLAGYIIASVFIMLITGLTYLITG